MVIKSARTGGELLLGAVEEVQHVGGLLPEPGKGVVVVEVEFAELAETLAELHHRAAVVLNAGCWRQMQNNSSTDCSWHAYAVPESNNYIRPDLVEEVVEADGALEEAVEERPRGVLGAVPELLHHVVVLAAVEQRHRRVEPSSRPSFHTHLLITSADHNHFKFLLNNNNNHFKVSLSKCPSHVGFKSFSVQMMPVRLLG